MKNLFLLGVLVVCCSGCGDPPNSSRSSGNNPSDPNVNYKETYRGPAGLERTREYNGPVSQDPWKKK